MHVTQSLLHRPGRVDLIHFLNTQPWGDGLFDPRLKTVCLLNDTLSTLTGVHDLKTEHGGAWIYVADRQRVLAERGGLGV